MSAQEYPPKLKASFEATKVSYKQLGKSGLRVSVPIFGCVSFPISIYIRLEYIQLLGIH